MTGPENIFEIIKAGDLSELQRMIEADKSLAMSRDAAGVSALMTAAYYRRPDMVRLLRDTVSELDIFEAAALGDEQTLGQLIGNEDNILSYSSDGFTPLHLAAFFNQPGIVKILMDHCADVNAIAENPGRVQALHSATACGSTEIVKILLEHGAEVNARQHGGWTALQAAAKHGNLEMVQLLLRHGADPEQPADNGQSALTLAADDSVRQLMETPGA